GYIYTQPVEQIYWRAPAAGSAITLFLIIWIAIDYRAVKNNPDAQFPYGPIHLLSPSVSKSESEPFAALIVPNDKGGEDELKLDKVADARKGHAEYRNVKTNDPIPSTPLKIIVVENGERSVFEPDKDKNGKFIRESGQPLLYRDKKGRVLTEGPLFERKTSL